MTTYMKHGGEPQQPWTPIHEPPHSDAYIEYIKGKFRSTDVNGEIVEVENNCVYGCGHCGVVAKTRDELARTVCDKDVFNFQDHFA